MECSTLVELSHAISSRMRGVWCGTRRWQTLALHKHSHAVMPEGV